MIIIDIHGPYHIFQCLYDPLLNFDNQDSQWRMVLFKNIFICGSWKMNQRHMGHFIFGRTNLHRTKQSHRVGRTWRWV